MLVFQGESAADELCFTADGTRLLAARSGGLVDTWELATGKRKKLLGPRKLNEVSRSTPPRVNLCANGFALRSRPHGPTEFAHIDGRTETVSLEGAFRSRLSPDGSVLVVSAYRAGDNVFDGYAVRTDGTFALDQRWSVQSETNWEILGFAGTARFVTHTRPGLRSHSAKTGECEQRIEYGSYTLPGFSAAPDGTRFAILSAGTAYLYNTADSRKSVTMPKVAALAFHPERPIFACASGTLVKYLDATTGKPVKKFAWKLGPVRAVAFSADGALAAASAADGRIVVWDADA